MHITRVKTQLKKKKKNHYLQIYISTIKTSDVMIFKIQSNLSEPNNL